MSQSLGGEAPVQGWCHPVDEELAAIIGERAKRRDGSRMVRVSEGGLTEAEAGYR